MREIKFRAWDSKKMWHQGDSETSLVFYGQENRIPWGVYTDNGDRRIMTGDPKAILNTPSILMQYTGLKDKNEKEIYEGDILTDKVSGVRWVVKFGNCKRYAFCGWYVENEIINRASQLYGDYNGGTNSMVEIIGNMYENPELIKL